MTQKLAFKEEKTSIGKVESISHDLVDSTRYILCDGAEVLREQYLQLFIRIGTIYGPGNGTTTFNLPDLRGRFLRGRDPLANIDPEGTTRELGTEQGEELGEHFHLGSYACSRWRGGGSSGGAGKMISQSRANTNYTGGDETRPINKTVNFYIKYGV